ncbi:MAG: SDR family NAD(P)-dependent oxidoreductase [Burkholderiaceae bacterium]
MDRFNRKVAVVTGGASGIGEATVRKLVKEGARVGFCDVDQSRGSDLANELNTHETDAALFVPADVKDSAQVEALLDDTARYYGRLDILVNNAAKRNFMDVTEASLESWDDILQTNLMGFIHAARSAIPKMQDVGGGVIVNLASVRSVGAGSKTIQYDTTKAAILGLTRNLARDHASDGIRVVAIAPGPIYTSFHEQRAQAHGESDDQYKAHFGAGTMLGRPGTPEEVANAIAFVASDEASFVTGTCLFVDGGLTGVGAG